ncbi:MAG: DUF441 family protein [Bacillota bacterium]
MDRVAEALIAGGILILGWLGKNHLVVWACLALIALIAAGWTPHLGSLEEPALKAGLTLLTLSILIPFVRRVKDLGGLWESLASPLGLFAALTGAVAAYLAGKGVPALRAHPEMAIGLIVGSVVGATLLRGVPTGPLIAAGVTGILMELWGRLLRG